MKKYLLAVPFLIAGNIFSPAQESINVTSPSATEFVRYERVPVSYFNGLPSIEIPLYTIESNGMTLPISVSYYASGIRVNQYPTCVGLGCNLNAGDFDTERSGHSFTGQPTARFLCHTTAASGPLTENSCGSVSTGSESTGADSRPYRFNGKESQEFAGLPYLDYGARFYHTLSARWTTPDPLAEKYCSVSPYAFCAGNPVNFVDPDGRIVIPKGTDELNIIRNTIPESDREYVQLNANGHYWAFAKTGRVDKRIKSGEHISYLMIKFSEKRIYRKWSEYNPCR